MKKSALFTIILGVAVSFSACKKDKDAESVQGCTDSNSLTYNPLATDDDGSCVIPLEKQKALVLEFYSTG